MTDATLREVCGQKLEELQQNVVSKNKVWKGIKFGKGILMTKSKTCFAFKSLGNKKIY